MIILNAPPCIYDLHIAKIYLNILLTKVHIWQLKEQCKILKQGIYQLCVPYIAKNDNYSGVFIGDVYSKFY